MELKNKNEEIIKFKNDINALDKEITIIKEEENEIKEKLNSRIENMSKLN